MAKIIEILIDFFLAIYRKVRGRRDMALPKTLYLTGKEIDMLLEIAVCQRPNRYPICRHPAATHAAGVAVASFAAQCILAHIKHIRDQFDTCCGEIIIERNVKPKRFEEVLDMLLKLNASLLHVTGDHRSSSDLKQSRDFLVKAFSLLPEKSELLGYHNKLMGIRQSLQKEVISDLRELLWKTYRDKRQKQEPQIRNFFDEKLAILYTLYGQVDKIVEDMSQLVQKLKGDWDKSVDQLWETTGCQFRSVKRRGEIK